VKVFITGGSSGIGLELTKLYLKERHEVGVCGRGVCELDPSLLQNYPLLKVFECDVANRDELCAIVSEFARGRLDLMIANAGFSVGDNQVEPDFDLARKMVDTNAIGVINAFEAAYGIMRQQGYGHLVATSSVGGMVGLPRVGAYSGSKAFVLKLCESLTMDLKQFDIHVTAVAPGFVDTALTKKNRCRMPFIMSANRAALLIKRAVDRKAVLYVFPWQMKVAIYFLERMPRRMYRFLMRLFAGKRVRGVHDEVSDDSRRMNHVQ